MSEAVRMLWQYVPTGMMSNDDCHISTLYLNRFFQHKGNESNQLPCFF